MAHEDNPFVTATTFKAARAGISPGESIEVYNEWASSGSYDELMNDETYKGASSAAKAAEELFPSNRENLLILDVCCGTGLVAEKLQRQGFKRIHGFDGSTGMLDLARPKNIYEKLICCFLDASPLPMDADTYDCALIAGGMCEGHIPTAGMRSLVRVIKPGGFIVIVMREAFLWEVAEYKDRLEKEMETMEKEGLWQRVSKTPLPNYFYYHMGVVFIFRRSLSVQMNFLCQRKINKP